MYFSIESRQLEALKLSFGSLGVGGGRKKRKSGEATAESFIIVLLAGDKAAPIIHFHR